VAGGLHLHARRVVIAAGAQSRDAGGGRRATGSRSIPNAATMSNGTWPTPLLSRPSLPHRTRLLLLPDGRAPARGGTVELGGLTLPPSPHRIARLVEGARAFFPDLGEPDRDWMGFRPSIPDSLPVIGPSTGRDRR
jgi:glycine/D-amino acid oxidase-like deaminating enzyme